MNATILLVAVPLLALGACAQPEESSGTASSADSASQTQTVRIAITGMT